MLGNIHIGLCKLFNILLGHKTNPYARKLPDSIVTFSKDGAWCWFQDPRAVYIGGLKRQTYAGWMTSNGKLQVGAYDHDTGESQVVTLKKKWDTDDHNTNSFLVLPDRRIMVFYARHNMNGLYSRTTSRPEDISKWEEEVTIAETHATYSHAVYLSDERRFYVFWRGESWKPAFSTSLDGKVWTKPQILIQDDGRDDRNIRPYFKVISDGKSEIHFAFTDGHPRDESTNSIYYFKYKQGKFYKANGACLGTLDELPIQHSASDVVYNGKTNNIRSWIWDIALDKEGNPVIAYTQLPSETDHRYHYASWTGDAWFDVEITRGGRWFPQTKASSTESEPHYSGGLSFDHANPSSVYLSRQVGDMFELEKWTTDNRGKTWSSAVITSNSMQGNVRPVVPRGYAGNNDHVLWMQGNYIHFTSYKTRIMLLVPKKSSILDKVRELQ